MMYNIHSFEQSLLRLFQHSCVLVTNVETDDLLNIGGSQDRCQLVLLGLIIEDLSFFFGSMLRLELSSYS